MTETPQDPLSRLSSLPYLPWLILGGHFLLWSLLGLLTDIHPDMADHWVWSRSLGWGYYEHPPLVALSMAPINWLGLDPVLGLKLGSALFMALVVGLAWGLARELMSQRAALGFLLLLESTAYYTQGSVFWHIDQPFMVFWVLGLWALVRLTKTGNALWMLAFGVAAGLGAESKYIMALLPLGYAVYLMVEPQQRWVLKNPGTYLGALLCLALLAPNLYWNAQHDWITLEYNFKKGLTGGNPLYNGSLFFLGHILLFSPIFALQLWYALGYAAWGKLKKRPGPDWVQGMDPALFKLILVTGLVPLVVFTLTSLKGKGSDPHWVNLAYLQLFLLVAHYWDRSRPVRFGVHLGRALALNLVLLLGFNLLLHSNPFGVGPKLSRSIQVLGWEATGQAITQRLEAQEKPLPPYVISREYWLSGALSLYLPNHPWPYTYEKCHHNLWTPGRSSEAALQQEGALLVCYPEECAKLLENMQWRLEVHPDLGCVRRPDEEKPAGLDFDYLGEIRAEHNGFLARRLVLYWLEPAP